MRKVVLYVWDHILIIACAVAFATSFTLGCASRPIQTEITVGPVSCKAEGTFFRCKAPSATWNLDGKYLVTDSKDFAYYAPKRWTSLEVYTAGWGVELWVRENGSVTEFSKEPK
jgi:hypothetical protein